MTFLTTLDDVLPLEHPARHAALTRRAFLEETVGPGNYDNDAHHERFEVLGDAWLGAIVLHRLMERFPKAAEGPLTQARAGLVRNEHLARLAEELDLGGLIRAGRGELHQGQHRTKDSLAGHVEALIGAAAWVGGAAAAVRLVDALLQGRWPGRVEDGAGSGPDGKATVNHKGDLNQREQKLHPFPGAEPRYTTSQVPGTLDNEAWFVSTVTLHTGVSFDGERRRTKKEAEQSAAQRALQA